MRKRSRTPTKKTRPKRASIAVEALQQAIKDAEGTGKNPLAVALGRLGGLKGGKARTAKLSPEERRESARKAARARWGTSEQEV